MSIRRVIERVGLLDTVKCIFNVIFNADPKSSRAADLVGGWLRRTTPLLNVLYDDQKRCANKTTCFSDADIDLYDIQRINWRVRSNIPYFRPTAQTINDILTVLDNYGNP